MRFPDLDTRTLQGIDKHLPPDLPAQRALLVLAFQQRHQRDVDEWLVRKGGQIKVCGSCMDARGLTQDDLVDGAERSTMDELTALTFAADKVLVF